MAALLVCDGGAVLTHRSAAALWDLLPYPATAQVCVTVASRGVSRGPESSFIEPPWSAETSAFATECA
jgi:hypothetical protein